MVISDKAISRLTKERKTANEMIVVDVSKIKDFISTNLWVCAKCATAYKHFTDMVPPPAEGCSECGCTIFIS